jgi:hypothetical protein
MAGQICGRTEETKLTLRRELQEAMSTIKQAPKRMNVSNTGPAFAWYIYWVQDDETQKAAGSTNSSSLGA